MKKIIKLCLFVLITIFLFSCESTDYKTKEVAVYKGTNNVDEYIELRFYNDTPNVPFIGVNQFFTEFYNTTYEVKNNNDVYTYKSKEGSYLKFDTKEDILTLYGVSSFSHNPQAKVSNAVMPIKEISNSKTTPIEKVISLKNYSIDVRGVSNDVYVPLAIMNNLAGVAGQFNVAYNGKNVYIIDYSGNTLDNPVMPNDYSNYYEVLDDVSTKRPKDLAEFNYNHLCFVFDNLRGLTSQLIMGDNNLLSMGLNGTLEKYYPIIKELLLSENKEDYYLGFQALFVGLFDGGHTGAIPTSEIYTSLIPKLKEMDEINPIVTKYAQGLMKELEKPVYQLYKKTLLGLENYSQYYTYDSENKLAIIGFDSFDIDLDGWTAFYTEGKNPSDAPVDTDSYAFMRQAFYQALADGATDVLIDLSTNGGGSSAALIGIVGLVNNSQAQYSTSDLINRSRSTGTYQVDINLDGKFDELDVEEAKKFNFRVSVLTSKMSFSCGNLLPSILKELGCKIIGNRSGGGSCAISVETSADGIIYVRSSSSCLTNASGDNIDSGVPLDFELPTAQLSATGIDVSPYYDFEAIDNYLKSLDE